MVNQPLYQIDNHEVLWMTKSNGFTFKPTLEILEQIDRRLECNPINLWWELCTNDPRIRLGLDHDLVLTNKSKLLKAYLEKKRRNSLI